MEKEEASRNLNEIRRMLRETEEEIREHRMSIVDYQLIWGTLVLLGLVMNILFLRFELYGLITFGWITVMCIGGFLSVRVAKRDYRKTGVTTLIDRATSMTWIGFAVCGIILMSFPYVSKVFNPLMIPALIAMLVGMAMFVEAFLLSWRVMIFGSILWWIAAIIMAIVPYISFYVSAALILITYLIPAMVVKIKQMT